METHPSVDRSFEPLRGLATQSKANTAAVSPEQSTETQEIGIMRHNCRFLKPVK